MPRIDYPAAGLALPPSSPGGAPTLNVERMIMHMPEALRVPFGQLGKAVLWRGSLDPALRELVLVRVGRLSNAPYELHHHEALALSVGVPQHKLDALHGNEVEGDFTPQERAVLAFADEVIRNVRPGDTALKGVQQFLSTAQIMELLVAIGVYMMVSRILETFGVELDEFALDDRPRLT